MYKHCEIMNSALIFYFCCISLVISKDTFILHNNGEIKKIFDNTLYFESKDWDSKLFLENTYNQTGWDKLYVQTNPAHSDEWQAYSAGYIEGKQTKTSIDNHFYNSQIADYCVEPYSAYCLKLKAYLSANLSWMLNNIALKSTTSSYWHHVHLQLLQLQGLNHAWQGKSFNPFIAIELDVFGLYLLQAGGDLEDLEVALKKDGKVRLLGSGSCSAFIKLLPDDIMTSHVTWTVLNSMTRILKKYEFHFHETADPNSPLISSGIQSFSSYPGVISSGDDFYIMGNGLVSLETTIGNNNDSLWPQVANGANSGVLEFLRSQVANRLAHNGSHWSSIFSTYNSGTYNNQWMIVDYSLFRVAVQQQLVPKENLLWIVEQIPGRVYSADKTSSLTSTSYWASYNIPALKETYEESGWPAIAAKFGSFFTYDGSPRARIFARDQGIVEDVKSMEHLMRYNDFRVDPLSRCNCTPPFSGENGISARSDLNDPQGTYPFDALGWRNHAATDMKLTNSASVATLDFWAQSGPTYQEQPVFSWSTAKLPGGVQRHRGMPDVWHFSTIFTNWTSMVPK